MSPAPIFKGRVLPGGLLVLDRPKDYARHVRAFAGQFIEIIVRKQRTKRSLDQNAWYWGCILKLIAEHTGYTVEELHEYCKSRFNAKPLILVNEHGEVTDERTIGLSTAALTTATFGDYCESIRQWAATDLGVVIPDPGSAEAA